VIED